MSPNAARHAVRPENRTRPVAVALVEVVGQPRDRCSRQNALPVVKILKYLSNPAVIDRSIVQIVIVKQTLQENTNQ